MKLIAFPSGLHVNMDNVASIDTNATSLVFNLLTNNVGTAATYLTNDPFGVLNQIYAFLSQNNGSFLQVVDLLTSYVFLTGVEPQPFSLSSDTIYIRGIGFNASMNNPNALGGGLFNNVIYVEDVVGGLDSNSACMQITYINSNMISAQFLGAGDAGTVPGPALLYYQGTSKQSNVLNVTIEA